MGLIVGYVLCIALTLPMTSGQDKVMTFQEHLQYIISKLMPNINSSCVVEACPQLKSWFQRPSLGDTGTLLAIIKTANLCMTKPMCGFVMDPVVIPEVTFITNGKPAFGNASVCSVVKGGKFAHASHARVTGISRTLHQLNISLFMPDLTVYGRLSCNGGQLDMSLDHFMTFNYTVVCNGTDVTVVNPKFTMIYIAYNTLSPQGNITRCFTQFDPQAISNGEVALGAAYRSFLAGFYRSVFEVASQSCFI